MNIANCRKYRAARKRRIPIVKPLWIEECLAYWRNVDKAAFCVEVPNEYDQSIGRELSKMPTFAKNELKSMADEVAAELDDLQSASSDDEAEDDEDKELAAAAESIDAQMSSKRPRVEEDEEKINES